MGSNHWTTSCRRTKLARNAHQLNLPFASLLPVYCLSPEKYGWTRNHKGFSKLPSRRVFRLLRSPPMTRAHGRVFHPIVCHRRINPSQWPVTHIIPSDDQTADTAADLDYALDDAIYCPSKWGQSPCRYFHPRFGIARPVGQEATPVWRRSVFVPTDLRHKAPNPLFTFLPAWTNPKNLGRPCCENI